MIFERMLKLLVLTIPVLFKKTFARTYSPVFINWFRLNLFSKSNQKIKERIVYIVFIILLENEMDFNASVIIINYHY